MFFRNPIPVVVALIEVEDGVLTVRRGIEPQKGQLALPGGFVDGQESWQEAACREVFEETSLLLQPQEIQLLEATSVDSGHLLLFCGCESRTRRQIDWQFRSPEVEELVWTQSPIELAFPAHTRVVSKHFSNTKKC
jgi:ADP-ribose pyrophosphatase YjhB (NUDIX family)